MQLGTWIVQILLAFLYAVHGWGMVTAPDRLRERIPYIFALSPGPRRLIGVTEMAGAAGLILPGLTGIMTGLTPLAALGLALLMIGAMVFHLRRAEIGHIRLNAFLLLLSLWVAYARWIILPLDQ